MKKFWSKIVAGVATLAAVLALSASAQAAPLNGQPSVNLSDNRAGLVSSHTVNFQTSTTGAVPAGGRIDIVYPAGFDLNGVTLGSHSANLGTNPTLVIAGNIISGQTIRITLDANGAISNSGTVSFQLIGVINNNSAGNYQVNIQTYDSLSSLIDGPTNSFDFSIQPRGPNQVNSSISPSGLNTMVVGTTQSITLTTRDNNGNITPNQDAVWSSSNPAFTLNKTTGITDSNGQDSVTLTAPTLSGQTTTVTVTCGTVVFNVTFTTQFTSVPGALHHFGLSNIVTPQTAGTAFSVVITPYDQYNNVITDYDWSNLANRPAFSGLNTVNAFPPSYTFVSATGGLATYNVATYAAQIGASITASLNGHNGISNSFDVDHSVINFITASPVGPLNLVAGDTQLFTAIAHDLFGNTWDISNSVTWIENDPAGFFIGNTYHAVTAGTWDIYANIGSFNSNVISAIVSPAALDHILITPSIDQTITAGATVQFTATGYDQYNNAINGLNFTWDNTNAAGLFTNTTVGTYPVQAHANGFNSNIVNVTVNHNVTANVTINPNTTQDIVAGADINFTATALDAFGNATGDAITWTGTSDVNSGLFNNRIAGTYTVYATANGVESTHVTVNVSHNVATSIAISPVSSTIFAGQLQTYTVLATDAYSNTWNATYLSSYSIVESGDNGSWNINIYNSHSAGTWTVRATYNGLISDATLIINHNVAISIVSNPNPSTILAGNTQSYVVIATDAYDNTWDVTALSAFSILESGDNGSWLANVYTSHTAGTWTVRATYNGLISDATLIVNHNITAIVTINPSTTQDVVAGTIMPFTAVAYDAYGNPTFDSIFWTGTNASFSGTFANFIAGAHVVYAEASGIQSTHVTVNVSPAALDHILITPSIDQTITAGTTVQFTATGYDQYNNVRSGDVFTWDNASSTGLFTNTATGTYPVQAVSAGIDSNVVNITVSPAALDHILIIPDTNQIIIAGTTVQFTATGYDQYGNVRSGDVFTWDNTDASGLFTNTTAGTYPVQAHSAGINSNIVNVTVNHNVTLVVTIAPDFTQNITAGSDINFIATAYDNYGNPTGDAITWTGTSGAGTGLFNNRIAGTYTVYATANGIESDRTTVNVAPAALDHIVITPSVDQAIIAGATIQFTITGYDIYGNVRSGDIFTWDNTDSSGLFSITIAGTYPVQAHSAGINSNIVNVTVNHNVATSINITPVGPLTMTADDSQAFIATATDDFGNTWDETNNVIWNQNDPLGSFTGNVYNAGLVGSWTISATLGILDSNGVTVNVTHGIATTLIARPLGPIDLTADGSQAFTADAYDNDGNQWDVSSDVVWNENDPSGSFTGNVYSAGTVGTWTIYATLGLLNSNNVTVNVSHGAAVSISITPNTVDNATSGTNYTFTSSATDADGNIWNITTIADYTIDADDAFGVLNTQAANERYTAGQIGVRHVTVHYQGQNAVATINIVNHSATVSTIQLVNNITNIMVGFTHQYQVRFRDAFGNSWDGTSDPGLVWTSSSNANAIVSTGGLLTGVSVGNGVIITVTFGTKSDTDTLNVIAAVGGVTSNGAATPGIGSNNNPVLSGDENGQVKGTEVETANANEVSSENSNAKRSWPIALWIGLALLILGAGYYAYYYFLPVDDDSNSESGNPKINGKNNNIAKSSAKVKTSEQARW